MAQLPKRLKVNPFNEAQYNSWRIFKINRTIQLNPKQIEYVCKLYAEIFMKPLWMPTADQNNKPLILMIDRLDIVYESYTND